MAVDAVGTTTAKSSHVPQLVLERPWTAPRVLLAEIWQARELCVTLAKQDFFVRYRRATIGIAWSVLLPAIQAVVLAVVLSRVAKLSVPHFPVFIFGGTVLWSYFSSVVMSGGTSIVDNSSLSSKTYFPRAILPLANALSNAFALLAGLIVLLIVCLATGVHLHVAMLYVVPAAALAIMLAGSLALVLAGLHVYFRDIKYLSQAAILCWFYITPIFFPLGRLHGWALHLVEINPITGPVLLMHAATVGGPIVATSLISTAAFTVGLAVIGFVMHCRLDRFFADLL
jgi:ABC-type polysaccharide/polyol phosphate export permease